jgi:CheY-like chemotaxis protein
MSSNVIELFGVARWRVLVAHQNGDVRHALRTLIETSDIILEEVADGEAALEVLEVCRFDLLVLELDLPVHDGVTLMQLHRVLLAHERVRVEPPAVIFTLAPEVRSSATLTHHLLLLGTAGYIDDAPRSDVASIVAAVLEVRAAQILAEKPSVA